MVTLKKTVRERISGLGLNFCVLSAIIGLCLVSATAEAQDEIRYSWFEIAYVGQDFDRTGTRISFADPLEPQQVDVNGSDGSGIKFRGSVGTWNNLYAFVDFASSDIDVASVVTVLSSGLAVSGTDEFDFTSIRGGVGLRLPLTDKMDIFGEVSYDSLDLDFGSLVGENFDTDAQDIGGALGFRAMIGDKLELRAYGRYTNVGDVDLNDPTGKFDSDVLAGAGFGIELVRALSITGDYESGEFSSWNLGFRLDISED